MIERQARRFCNPCGLVYCQIFTTCGHIFRTRHTETKKGGDPSKVDKDGASDLGDDEADDLPIGRTGDTCGTRDNTVDNKRSQTWRAADEALAPNRLNNAASPFHHGTPGW